jgi:hypothetical protein
MLFSGNGSTAALGRLAFRLAIVVCTENSSSGVVVMKSAQDAK